MFVDSNDTFILTPPEVILNTFCSLNTKILVSAEKNCWPMPGDAVRYPEIGASDYPGTPWRFVNSGGWIGLRVDLLQALGEMDNILVSLGRQGGRRTNDDQACWIEWVLCRHRHDIYSHVDARCQVFQSMWETTEMLGDGANSVTGAKPHVWHFNGRRDGMREWYERLAA
jgi:hypothetical protein